MGSERRDNALCLILVGRYLIRNLSLPQGQLNMEAVVFVAAAAVVDVDVSGLIMRFF